MPKQRGGGTYDEYCPLCGLPFHVATVFDFKKAGVNVDWLYKGVGFDFEKKLQFNLDGYDSYGNMMFTDKQFPKVEKAFKEVPPKDGFRITYESGPFNDREEDPYQGVAFHRACFKVIQDVKGGKMNMSDVQRLANYSGYGCDGSEYHEQDFDWDRALEEQGPEYFRSPLKNADFAGDIVECLHEGYFPDEKPTKNNKPNSNNKTRLNNKSNKANKSNANNTTKKNNKNRKPNNNKAANNKTLKNNRNNNNNVVANFKQLKL